MPVEIKICGLMTPEAVDVALDAGADLVGFVFFPPSPRHLGFEAARALGARVRGRAKQGRAVGRCRRRLPGRQHRGAQARHAAAARHGDAGARRRGAHPLRAAGDEGAADRDARRPLADPALRRRRRPADLRRARAARGDAARRARQELRLEPARRHRSRRAVHALGRARRRQRRRGAAHHPRAGGRRVVRRRACARRQGPRQDPRLHPRGARGRRRRARRSRAGA